LLHRFAVGAFCLVAAGAWAAPPTAFPFPEGLAPATLKARPATFLRLGRYRVQFERTAMLDIVRVLGLGRIRQQGQGGNFLAWICYAIPGARSMQRLWITSGELQGGQIIDGVAASAVPSASVPPTPDCPALPPEFQPVQVDGGIWLGSSRAAVDRVLPPVSSERAGWLEYEYEGRTPAPDPGSGGADPATADYDESDSLLLRLRGGQVVELFATETTTY
jgi:hypothetical protein